MRLPIRLLGRVPFSRPTHTRCGRAGNCSSRTSKVRRTCGTPNRPADLVARPCSSALLGPGELALRTAVGYRSVPHGLVPAPNDRSNPECTMDGLDRVLVLVLERRLSSICTWRVVGITMRCLVLFMTLSVWSLYRWSIDGRPKDILWFFAFHVLARSRKVYRPSCSCRASFCFSCSKERIALFRQRQTYIGLLALRSSGGWVLHDARKGRTRAIWRRSGRTRSVGVTVRCSRVTKVPGTSMSRLLIDHHFVLVVCWCPVVWCLGWRIGTRPSDDGPCS